MSGVMQALVWEGPRQMAVRDVPVPELVEDEVLVRVEAAGICGSELEGYVGAMANRVPPLVMGHEFAGRVVGGALDGSLVAVNPLLTCGTCADCLSGRVNICADRQIVGIHRPGAFAELVAVPANSVLALPAGLDPVAGALVEPLANVVHAIELGRRGQVPQSVLVLGAGSLGLLALQVARSLGTERVVVSDLNAQRLDVVAALGASDTVVASSPDAEERLLAKGGYDVVVDCVGAAPTKAQALRAARSGGAVVLLGLHDDASPLSSHEIIRRELMVTGSYTYVAFDVQQAIALLSEGAVRYDTWTESRPLSAGPDSFAELVDRPGAATKILLTPGDSTS